MTDICYPNIEKESATTIDRLELPQRTACRNKRNSLKHDIGKECQLASDPAKKNKKTTFAGIGVFPAERMSI